jgi:hypothetical protein
MTHLGHLLAAGLKAAAAENRAEMLANLSQQRAHAVARRAADLALICLIDKTITTYERNHP